MVKISVIVPCHNDGQYLPRCLDSLTGQTLQDIEILVVENRSSDNSQAVIEEYAQKDSRIKALSISTESLSLARNKGLDKASGTYVMFCDPDGWFEPDMCRIMYYAIENSETDIEPAAETAEPIISEPEEEIRNASADAYCSSPLSRCRISPGGEAPLL